MSEWAKGRKETAKEAGEMEKLIDGYSYQDPGHAERTDQKFRELLGEEIGKARDFLFPLMEAAYLEDNMDNAGAVQDLMQWVEVLALEMGLKFEWNRDATYKNYEKLIKLDASLLANVQNMAKAVHQMNEDVMKGKAGSVVKRCAEMKQSVSEIISSFKKRRHSLGG
jgi:hypothetical protein